MEALVEIPLSIWLTVIGSLVAPICAVLLGHWLSRRRRDARHSDVRPAKRVVILKGRVNLRTYGRQQPNRRDTRRRRRANPRQRQRRRMLRC